MKKLIKKLNQSPQNGSGLLAIFCDLSDIDRIDFYPWLIEDMFPDRLSIGFKNCASYKLIAGDGSQFLTMYEVPSLGYLYDIPYQKLRENRTLRDANFHKKFKNPERYTLVWAGPEISRADSNFEQYLIIKRFNISKTNIALFNTWYVSEYIPHLINNNLFLPTRRYICIEGNHNNFIIHDTSNLQTASMVKLHIPREILNDQISGTYELVIKRP